MVVPLILLGILVLPLSFAWASGLWQLAAKALDGLEWGLTYLAELPNALLYFPELPWYWLGLAMLGLLLILLPRGIPGRWLGLICLLPLLTWQPAKPALGEFRLTVLDVGQGLATALKQSGILAKPSEQKQFIEEVKFILYSQKGAFNSPVWFNLGLAEAYGVTSKSHHYAWDFKQKKVKEIFDAYERPQCSACFIQSVEDSLESIFDLIKRKF